MLTDTTLKLLGMILSSFLVSFGTFKWLLLRWAKEREDNEAKLMTKIEHLFANATSEREARRTELETVERALQLNIDHVRDSFGKEILVLRERWHEHANHITATTTAVRNLAELVAKVEGYMRENAQATTEHVGAIQVAIARLESRLPK